MAQASDRWVAKILALPIFNVEFANAVQSCPLGNLALIAAMDVHSASEFVLQVADWSQNFEKEVAAVLLKETAMLEQFWSLACSVEKNFFESTAQQLGFGLCEPRQLKQQAPETDRLKRAAAVRDLLSRPVKAPRTQQLQAQPGDTSSTPLFDQESAERWKWAARLEAIGKRARGFARLWDETPAQQGLAPHESARLRQLVLIAGAPRTMAVHIRLWERMEEFFASKDTPLYPLTEAKVMKFALDLDQKECGPSVIPSLRTAIKWVTARLVIDCPDLDSPAILALQQEVITNRAKTLKEAVPVPMTVVIALEKFVTSEAPQAARLFIWWWLCMIFASLRFDDAIHVKPKELVLQDEGLFGIAWQTKVDRKRKGTKFAVPRVGFSSAVWLQEGWNLLQKEDLDRDFWVEELNSRESFKQAPPTYQRSVQWLKVLAREALDHEVPDHSSQEWRDCAKLINSLTAHSARVTLLDAAVHAGRSTEEIGLQANWKNPGPMVLKYTRNRSTVPAQMVSQLVQDLVSQRHPVADADDTEFVEAGDQAEDQTQFFVKQGPSLGSGDIKYHCSELGDSSKIACGKLLIQNCAPVGVVLPDLTVLCKACAKARPDIVCSFSKSSSSSAGFGMA